MKMRYLIVDAEGQLALVRRRQVERLWRGRLKAQDLGSSQRNELRLISVLCDEQFLPKRIYLLRLPLTGGRFTRLNYRILRVFSMPECVTPKETATHHTTGWPNDFYKQLAVALDVPVKQLQVPMGVGGPLLMAAAMRVTPSEALRYLR
ncbi:MAG: hypothetical protein K2X38_09140 [Gemmataceae bacterium]|nr:hypothetical protein [Gemmataceae bacterium]